MLPRRFGPLIGSSDLLAELARIRRRRAAMFALLLGFLPATMAVDAATGSREIALLVAVVWMIVAGIVALWTTYTPCPGCTQPFFTGALASQLWAPRCGHCGQELEP